MNGIAYYLYGDIPVMMEVTPDGSLQVLAYNAETRCLVPDTRYRSLILHDRDGLAREIDVATFTRLTSID